MKIRGLVCALALATLSAACGGGNPLHVPPHVIVDTRGVAVEGTIGAEETEDFPAAFDTFFPAELSVHPGDRIFFDAQFTGEPHTITMGILVDAAAARLEELGSDASLPEIEALPEMQALPSVFPRTPGDGPLRINRSAAEPCFLDSGSPPNPPEGGAPPCPTDEQPTFDGTQAFYSSGWIAEESFEVNFAEDIAPGTYTFMCLVHRSEMMGTIEVVGEDEPVPGKPAVTEEANAKLNGLETSLDPVADDLAVSTPQGAAAGAGRAIGQAKLVAFSPERFEIAQGETVTWNVSGLHTISVEPEPSSGELLQDGDDGLVFNEEVVTPTEGAPPVPAPVRAYPPPADGQPVTLTATWDGEGWFNSGLLWSVPPVTVTYQLTFTQPGTYALQCLVHPQMQATVEVT